MRYRKKCGSTAWGILIAVVDVADEAGVKARRVERDPVHLAVLPVIPVLSAFFMFLFPVEARQPAQNIAFSSISILRGACRTASGAPFGERRFSHA
jgi:hypothetical protein